MKIDAITVHTHMHAQGIGLSVSEIDGLASQLATQNCLGCHLILNLGSKFHVKVATHLPHIKLRILGPLYFEILYYNKLLLNC